MHFNQYVKPEKPAVMIRSLYSIILASLLITAMPGAYAQGDKIDFNIEQKQLAAAMKEFAEQANLQIMFAPHVLDPGKRVSLKGSYTSAEALAILLKDTGLEYVYDGSGSIAVRLAGSKGFTGPPTTPLMRAELERDSDKTRHIAANEAGEDTATGKTGTTPSTKSPKDKDYTIEEIVVTSTRTGETLLQETPITITSINSEDLDNANAASLSDLTALVPNSTFNYWGVGKLSGYIRGVGAQLMNWGEDARIGFYIDDVFIDKGMAANTSFFDIERVEVLRGPQGTLYGRNTTGGAVNIITKKPSDELEMGVGVEVGNYDKLRVDATISGPIANDVKGRVSISHSNNDGYMENLSGPDLFDEDYTGVRGALVWALTDRLDVTVRADYYYAKPRGFQNRLMTDTGLFASLAVAAGIPRSEYLPDDFWTTSQDFEGLNKLELWGISGHLDFEINETLHLKSITTYRDTFNHVKQDQDSLTLVLAHDSNWVNYDQFTQELQLIGSIDRWKWMAGFFYLDLDERRQGGNEFSFIVPGLQRLADGRNSVETLALYANATFDITDQLSIEAGLRYTYEEKGGSFEQWGVPDIIPSFNRLLPEDFRDWNDWSPKVGLNYKPIDDVLLYGVVSKGFKSGFKVPTNPVDNPWIDPEKLWNYEVGIKSDWFDDRLRVNGSFFYYDYTDMQIRTFFVPPSG